MHKPNFTFILLQAMKNCCRLVNKSLFHKSTTVLLRCMLAWDRSYADPVRLACKGKVTEGVSGHAADFLLFKKRTATGRSCGRSTHMPHFRALRGCSLVSNAASTTSNER